MMVRVLFSSILFCLGLTLAAGSLRQYDGHTVYRLKPTSVEQLRMLKQLSDVDTELDFWTYPTSLNSTVDIMVSPEKKSEFLSLVASYQINWDVMINDVQNIITNQMRESQNSDARDIFDDYQSLANIHAFLDDIASSNDQIASTEVIGKSTESRDLKILKLGVNSSPSKPAIWIDGGIHAREWISPATVLYMIQSLVDGYKNNDATIVSLLTKFDWVFLPSVNPDGYEYSRASDRMWRKTRTLRSGSTCRGVDANRNYNYRWMTGGASTNPCSDTYGGPSALSEPETKIVTDYIRNLNTGKRLKICIAVHSYSQLFLTPWGHTSALPPDYTAMKAKGDAAISALTAHYGTRYTLGNVATGGATDWCYGDQGVIYSYTIELRDTGANGFLLPKAQIRPSGIETFSAIRTMAQAVANEV